MIIIYFDRKKLDEGDVEKAGFLDITTNEINLIMIILVQ